MLRLRSRWPSSRSAGLPYALAVTGQASRVRSPSRLCARHVRSSRSPSRRSPRSTLSIAPPCIARRILVSNLAFLSVLFASTVASSAGGAGISSSLLAHLDLGFLGFVGKSSPGTWWFPFGLLAFKASLGLCGTRRGNLWVFLVTQLFCAPSACWHDSNCPWLRVACSVAR
jgi:hypothetical protein